MASVPLVPHVGQQACRLQKGSLDVNASPTAVLARNRGVWFSEEASRLPKSSAYVDPAAANQASMEPSSLMMIDGPYRYVPAV